MNGTTVKDLGVAIVGLAMLTTILVPRGRDTSRLVAMQGQMFNESLQAAIALSTPTVDTRTPAERFQEDAYNAIGDFWSGFGDNYTGDF